MRWVGISQRVDVLSDRGERRDCLDQRWCTLLDACGLQPLLLPNQTSTVARLLDAHQLAGIILTGGNDLVELGGDAPERDAVEYFLLERALATELPLLGVCRGMQLIQQRLGVPLIRVDSHVSPEQTIAIDGQTRAVNSYHRWGARETVSDLEVWAEARDGVVKAVRHRHHPVAGVMWHPERMDPFADDDIALFQRLFGPPTQCTAEAPRADEPGTVYWICGLSAAGKTTIGRRLCEQLRHNGRPVLLLDGDEVRETFNDLGHSRGDRRRAAGRYSRLSKLISSQGIDVVCCTISMFKDCWSWNLQNIPRYREIYVRVPMDLLVERDPKGLYQRALRGEISNVWGVDMEWDEPSTPHMVIDNDGQRSPSRIAREIIAQLSTMTGPHT